MSVDHATGGNLGAELAQAKRREAEAASRVAALEAKLKSSSSVHGEMQASVQELSHRLQVCTTILLFVMQVPCAGLGQHHQQDQPSTCPCCVLAKLQYLLWTKSFGRYCAAPFDVLQLTKYHHGSD